MRFIYLLRPFPLAVGLLGLSAFLMQGATYAMLKTEGDIHGRAKAIAEKLVIVSAVLLAAASAVAFVFLDSGKILTSITGWISFVIVVVSLFMLKASIKSGTDMMSFILSSLSFFGLWGMAGSYLFPNLVINNAGESITIFNASSSQLTLTVMLIIALIGVPVMLGYTIYVYRIFKGKVVLKQ
jgi:cytochrome d ubiquinol oxidase subunit II